MARSGASLRFSKMHGAGNDFVVLDLRGGVAAPSPATCRALADRHTGVGCDQILTVEAPRAPGSVASYRIWNADGSASGQCGNGARCVAAWLVRDGAARAPRFALDSPAGSHAVDVLDDGTYRIAMGVPRFDPGDVPLAGLGTAQAVYTVDLAPFGAVRFGAVSMGNPHAVLEVDDVDAAPVATLGPQLQRAAWFPESANIGFAQVVADDRIRLRVFERGVGETLACGSGACAAVAVLVRQGRVGRDVAVALPGGTLRIVWPDDAATLTMAGPAAFVFEGETSDMSQTA
ncbi:MULTISPECIES: diaminopimelate epimerase [Luteimonas]|uniref:diaminopimelate epimerase n=1 Tax=Luteimonas TaxID=83614 RepID=UPI000C7E666F|nr:MULTISPECIES: diaminopimelate epimerase [Luteimonas]